MISAVHDVALAGLADARLFALPVQAAPSGSLAVVEGGSTVPFAIARTFHVWGVPAGEARGRHAHRLCRQVLVCLAGSCHVTCRDGTAEAGFRLDRPDRALFVPAAIWAEQVYERDGTVLLVLADRPYEADDYIRDWDDFRRFRGIA